MWLLDLNWKSKLDRGRDDVAYDLFNSPISLFSSSTSSSSSSSSFLSCYQFSLSYSFFFFLIITFSTISMSFMPKKKHLYVLIWLSKSKQIVSKKKIPCSFYDVFFVNLHSRIRTLAGLVDDLYGHHGFAGGWSLWSPWFCWWMVLIRWGPET